MFVNVVHFPPIKDGKDSEFRDWFAWSNQEFAKHKGFIKRRLLKPLDGGNYAAIVEHESHDTFMDMHISPTQANALQRVLPLFNGSPSRKFYEVIVG
jgi:heme-degrading monooxygenase HmoA